MTEKEFNDEVWEQTKKIYNAVFALQNLAEDYRELTPGEGLEVYHTMANAIRVLICNGGKLMDIASGTVNPEFPSQSKYFRQAQRLADKF